MEEQGNQRLSLQAFQQFQQLGYGMFIHYGMSTFVNEECPDGEAPSSMYAPEKLDVGQWLSVARDAGMKYAVLTTKHVSGHALWPTKQSDYSVATSADTTDVVGEFVCKCRKKGLLPGFYYCIWDRHNKFGSLTPRQVPWGHGYTTDAYRQFMMAQLEELFTNYGDIAVAWIDIPYLVERGFRHTMYDQIANWQPQALITFNHGLQDGRQFDIKTNWPSDFMTMERFLPNCHRGYDPWKQIEGATYYLPGEVTDPIGDEWFWTAEDKPRDDALLLGNYLVTRSRGCNFLLNVPPDRRGLIPQTWIDPLIRLRQNIDKIGFI